ncbi:MAG TPA: DUF4340 domain-containing protein [Steroidobacteraceae bacterium]|nr:DUF4340 domain-containing protein [Steroidobacteraceae bacterium]
MTPRRVVGLLVAAAVIIAVGFWASSRHRNDVAVSGEPVLTGLKAAVNDVTEVRLAKGDGTHVTLKKTPTAWNLVEREYPADSGKVRKLLLDLSSLEVVEEKTSDPASYAKLGVEDVNSAKATGTRVEAVTPKKVYGLIVGRFAGMKSSYVRATDAPKSYLASPSITADADPKQWLERDLLDIPEARVKDVAIKPASGPEYTVSREKKEQTDFTVSNIPKGRELTSPSAGNTVAGELTSFTLDDVRKLPADAKPEATATFHTFDGLELQISGQKDGDRRYVSITPRSTAKETESEAKTLTDRVTGWQYEIPSYKYDALFRPLDELLKKPEPKEEKKKASSEKKPAASSSAPTS